MSPLILHSKVLANILLGDTHSDVRRQLTPQISKPITSDCDLPNLSPRIVTFVPGGPSFGEIPVTRGAAIAASKQLYSNLLT